MKKLLDAVVVWLGTACMFGLPIAALALSAWFGDGAMKIFHPGNTVGLSLSMQLGVIALMFCTTAVGLLLAAAFFTFMWWATLALERFVEREEPPVDAHGATAHPEALHPRVAQAQRGSIHKRIR